MKVCKGCEHTANAHTHAYVTAHQSVHKKHVSTTHHVKKFPEGWKVINGHSSLLHLPNVNFSGAERKATTMHSFEL